MPAIDGETWTLAVDGLADDPQAFSLADIMAMPKTVETATVKCVEGPFGTAEWGGVSLAHVLELAGASESAYDVIFYSSDGFSTSLSLEDATAEGVILAYEMNGETLPAEQGYPVRLVAPEKYGYKWAKWITHIEVVDYDHLGFWESRGWDDDATVSSYTDWGWHAALLTVSAVLCGLACISGFRFAPEENFWTDLPDFISRNFHIWVSKAYFFVAVPVFGFWSWTTLQNRGAVFYSGHGTLALIVFCLTIAGMATGGLAMWKPRKFLQIHLMLSTLCFFILVGTILVGIYMITGTLP
ncbi:MAG: molybdopterin-dependent oxidoreductase [Thermoplasmata archaeon]|nr:molybdopterin-dependent oxidoreductase [Thermoplasmata archaeon]